MLPAYIKRDDIRGLYPQELNCETARAIGYAVCRLLAKNCDVPRIAIGYDCRHGNLEIQSGFAEGFQKAGGSCVSFGLLSTEHIYYICGTRSEFTAGAMITASHNPKEYNGIKLLHGGCLPFTSAELVEIGETAAAYKNGEDAGTRQEQQNVCAHKCEGCTASCQGISNYTIPMQLLDFKAYAEFLLRLSGLDRREVSPHAQIRIVVLAGHGMGALAFGAIAEMMRGRGLQSTLIEPEPNGDFPEGVPNPLDKKYMARLSEQVQQHQADLGICFDGDADRAGFVDATGEEILPSQVLALIAQHRLQESRVKEPVVMRNLCCSRLLEDLFPKNGPVTLIDTPVGHGRIKLLMRHPELQSRCVFAGEHSGHYFYPDFFYLDSGVLTSLFMIEIVWRLREQRKSLSELLAAWRQNYVWSGEINFNLKSSDEVLPVMTAVWKAENKDGVRRFEVAQDPNLGVQRVFENNGEYQPQNLPAPDLKMQYDGEEGWWFVIRPSGNEPKLRLNVEAWGSNAKALCKQKSDELIERLLSLGAFK